MRWRRSSRAVSACPIDPQHLLGAGLRHRLVGKQGVAAQRGVTTGEFASATVQLSDGSSSTSNSIVFPRLTTIGATTTTADDSVPESMLHPMRLAATDRSERVFVVSRSSRFRCRAPLQPFLLWPRRPAGGRCRAPLQPFPLCHHNATADRRFFTSPPALVASSADAPLPPAHRPT